MRSFVVTPLLVVAVLGGCAEESFCERVDCDDVATTSSSQSTGALGSTSTTTSGPGSGGSDQGGAGAGSGAGGTGAGTGGAGPLEVTPGEPKVGILRPLDFDATADVEWSVVEDDGGTIDAEGRYVSPEEPGTFHVLATATDGGGEIEVEVTVVRLGLDVAGGIPGGAGNLDGVPTRARFDAPRGAAMLVGGDILVADTGNHTIRIFRSADGEVTTLAGSPGVPGSASGIGSAARFDSPTAVAVIDDHAYVVDGDGTCIRDVDATSGVVTRLAGACGTSQYVNASDGATSRFLAIQAIEVSPDGDGLVVCDPPGSGATNKLRRVDVSTGQTTESTLEGVPFGTPCHLTPDPSNERTYLHTGLDSNVKSNAVGSITALDLVVAPGTDDAIAGLAFVDGVDTLYAFDRERPGGSGTPYVTILHAFALGDAAFEGISGGSDDYVDGPLDEARFLTPGFLVPTPSGDLLFGDQEGHTVRRVSFEGTDEVETLLGVRANVYPEDGSSTVGRLLNPYHVALGDDGDLFVAGAFPDNSIRRIDGVTRAIETFSGVRADYVIGSAPSFETPVDGQADEAIFGVIFDVVRVGDALYVADSSSAIREVSVASGTVDTVAGAILQADFADGTGSAARFDFSDSFAGLATDGTDLFVADSGNHAIRRVDLSSNEVTTIAGGTEGTADGTGDEAQFIAPVGIAYDDGFLYVADAGAHTIRRVEIATGEVTTLTGAAGLPGYSDGGPGEARFAAPFRIAADGIGNLYVTSLGLGDDVPHTIRRIRLADVETLPFAGDDVSYGFADGPLPATLGCPGGMVVDAAGDLLFADVCDGAVGAIRAL